VDSRGYTPHLLADLDGTGRRSVCLPVRDHKQHAYHYQVLILDAPGRVRHTLDISPSSPETVPFRLWSHDLDGDGKEELLFVSAGKVRAVKVAGAARQPAAAVLWEWPPTGGAGDILGVQPPVGGYPAVVAVWSGGTVHGLDGPTGRLRWRCDGPGQPVALLPGPSPGEMPGILFHVSSPESTICQQAVPVFPGGKYGQPRAAPLEAMPAEGQVMVVPLPWEVRARQKLARAVLPGLACLVLLIYAARKRSRRTLAGLLACLLVVPLVVAVGEWREDFPLAEERYAWGGWYWLWPYALSAPGDWGLLVPGVSYWLRSAGSTKGWRGWSVLLLLTAGFALPVCWGIAYNWSLPDGLTWRSPLVWMAAVLLWRWPAQPELSSHQVHRPPANG
jgi:hypothetical protein